MSDQPAQGLTRRQNGQGARRRARSLRPLLLGTVLVCLGGLVVPARAQYVPGYFPTGVPGYGQELGVTVVSRLRPLYEAPGLRLGSFILRPDLTESSGYNTNVPGIGGGPGSPVIETNPSLAIASDWGRNALGANLTIDNFRYLATPSQNRTDWTAAIGGTETIGRSDLTLAYAHLALHESATDIGAPLSTTPIPFTVDDVRAADRFDLGPLAVTPTLEASFQRYGTAVVDGLAQPQNFRNVNEFIAGMAFHYALSDQRALVLTVQAIRSDYPIRAPGAASLNSSSVLALGGLDSQYDGVWRYQALVGVEVRAFDAAQFKTRVAPIARAAVIWTPTELTTVTATLLRTIEAPVQPETSGFTYTAAELRVDHEYFRNVLLHARAGIERVAYLQNATTQTGYNLGAGITWLINRHLHLTAEYLHRRQTTLSGPSAGAGSANPGYTQNIFLLSLHLSL